MSLKRAISLIEKRGALLIFPINNRIEPPSLWFELHPGEKMLWEWDEDGDSRVSDLWHLKTKLSASGKVVYTKWYQGRATAFSFPVFKCLLALSGAAREETRLTQKNAETILGILKSDSPLSTKQLREACGLKGKENAAAYERALKELWRKFLIVGFGEVEDGAFPSLAIGATEVIFENLWEEAKTLDHREAKSTLEKTLTSDSLFIKAILKDLKPASESKPREERERLDRKPSVVSFAELSRRKRF